MGEIKTEPVVAQCFDSIDDLRERGQPRGGNVPGAIHIEEPDDDGEQMLAYCCPCGCGRIGYILIGNGFKPDFSPSWKWNGSRDKSTLTPSVHHVGHWHGWLTDGVWRSC